MKSQSLIFPYSTDHGPKVLPAAETGMLKFEVSYRSSLTKGILQTDARDPKKINKH